jgi:hypothetical protein
MVTGTAGEKDSRAAVRCSHGFRFQKEMVFRRRGGFNVQTSHQSSPPSPTLRYVWVETELQKILAETLKGEL